MGLGADWALDRRRFELSHACDCLPDAHPLLPGSPKPALSGIWQRDKRQESLHARAGVADPGMRRVTAQRVSGIERGVLGQASTYRSAIGQDERADDC